MEHRPVFAMLGTIVGVVVALLVLTTVGCGASSPPPIAERDAATATPPKDAPTTPLPLLKPRSTKERLTPAAGSDISGLVDGNNAFALDLYRTLSKEDGNLFYSPYSISLAMAMAYAGARGETATQFAETLHYRLPQEELHSSFNALDLDLASRGKVEQGKDQTGFQLNIANAVWGQQGYRFLGEFLDLLEQNYGGGLRVVNFRDAPGESREKINSWVVEQTEGKIRNLLPQDAIDSLTRLVLTNAIHFDADWAKPFEPRMTLNRQFHRLDGNAVLVPMMPITSSFGYTKGDGYQAVEMDYAGVDISMVILLPDEGRFREFEDSLNSAVLDRTVGNFQAQRVKLTLPKFEFDSQFALAPIISGMGMPNAFSDGTADLSGIDGRSCAAGDRPCLVISHVVHKAFVAVDEAGTEASAATGVVITAVSEPPDPITVTVDRPFVFLIRDKKTKTILFIGRVENPEGF